MKRILTIIISAALLLVLPASCNRSIERPLTAGDYLSLGEKYLLELDYEQALVQFLKVIEIEPMNPRGYTGAAEAYVGLGDTESAIEVLKQGEQLLPDNIEIQNLLYELQQPENNDSAPNNTDATPEMISAPPLNSEPESPFESGPESDSEPKPEPEMDMELEAETAEELEEGLIAVIGTIINNIDEYNEEFFSYRAQHPNSESGVVMIRNGIRFSEQIVFEIDGNTVFADEAVLVLSNITTGVPASEDISEFAGKLMKMTGHFSLADPPAGLTGPDPDGVFAGMYHFNPNGDYEFEIVTYELLGS